MPKILLLNDNILGCKIIEMLLNVEGNNFQYTTSSVKALSILQTEPIDLFIQDILRPNDINGFELYWLMKSDNKLCDIPILILSMWSLVEAPVELSPVMIGGRIFPGIYQAVFNNYKPEWLKMLKHIKDPNILFIEGHECENFPSTLNNTVETILKNQSLLTEEERSFRHKHLWSKAKKIPRKRSA